MPLGLGRFLRAEGRLGSRAELDERERERGYYTFCICTRQSAWKDFQSQGKENPNH